MPDEPRPKRKGKPLLVASIGVATVSYLALQSSCTDDVEEMTLVANLLAPPIDASFEPMTGVDAATPQDAALDALVTSGNLLPPPAHDASLDALVPTGNLLPPPAHDASLDALVPTGNLLPPPTDACLDGVPDADTAQDAAADAAKDASQPHDAKVDTGLPTSGNLLPPPPRDVTR